MHLSVRTKESQIPNLYMLKTNGYMPLLSDGLSGLIAYPQQRPHHESHLEKQRQQKTELQLAAAEAIGRLLFNHHAVQIKKQHSQASLMDK